MKPDISIIIINWKSKDYVRGCLRSLRQHAGGVACEVIVLDNASYDGCADMLAATPASADLLLFLNPVTEVRDGALRRLCDCMKTQPDAGAVGARLLNTDGTLQTSCIQAFPTLAGEFFDAEFLRRLSPR